MRRTGIRPIQGGGLDSPWQHWPVQTTDGAVTIAYFERDGQAWTDDDVSVGDFTAFNNFLDRHAAAGEPVPISALRSDSRTTFYDLEMPFRWQAGEFPAGLNASSFRGFACDPASPPAVPSGSTWASGADMCNTTNIFIGAMVLWENEVPGLRFVPYDAAIHGEYAELRQKFDCSITRVPVSSRINVHAGKCGSAGVASHEIGHVLGL